jgi:hypothetical protein
MVTARATGENGVQVIILGLTRVNVQHLLSGRPITVTPETHPGLPEKLRVAVFFGETERACAAQLKAFITDETKVIAVPKDAGLIF